MKTFHRNYTYFSIVFVSFSNCYYINTNINKITKETLLITVFHLCTFDVTSLNDVVIDKFRYIILLN